MSIWRSTVLVALVVMTAAPVDAQTLDGRSAPLFASREGLQQLLAQYDEASRSGGYSAEFRARAEQEAELIRTRLEEGDFQLGDRILLTVAGQATLTDTFTVATGRVIHLPNIGEVSLRGLLRSELAPYMRETIGKYVRNAEVRVGALVRIAVMGQVGTPGFHWVGADVLLADLIMVAGGPTGDANVEKAEIERGARVIWQGDPMRVALQEGHTIDQMSLRSGDQLQIPAKTSGTFRTILGALPYLIPIGFALSRLF